MAPGTVATENTTRQLFGGGQLFERLSKENPVGRFGTVEEMANAAAYLVSDYAEYINGECLTLDGGSWLNKGYLKYMEDLQSGQK